MIERGITKPLPLVVYHCPTNLEGLLLSVAYHQTKDDESHKCCVVHSMQQ